jgi:hypothetical protein
MWGTPIPFEYGKTWIRTSLYRTNNHIFLFDLESRKVLGEMTNGSPIFANATETKILCEGWDSFDNSLKGNFLALLMRISFGRLHFNTDTIESFWVLDLRNNSAKRLGDVTQWRGTGSYWKPAPGFRFGYNVPNNEEEGTSFFLCDLDRETFKKIYLAGSIRGWWSDHEILVSRPPGDFLLYDVLTEKTSSLVPHEAIAALFQQTGINDAVSNVATQNVWTGSNYNFFLIPKPDMSLYTNGHFLIQLEPTASVLKVSDTNFNFHWLGVFDSSQKYYAYPSEPGPPGRGGNAGVYLRDLAHSNTITIIPPNNNIKAYAIPRFYRDNLIYNYSNELWTAKLDNSQKTRLFPPPEN